MTRRVFAIFLTLILLLGSGCSTKRLSSEDALTVYFFDVGQADSSLLLFPDGTTMLIDAGNIADGEYISDFLKSGDIETIDYFFCTHPHEDHIGGAVDIFDNFKINNLCMPNIDDDFTPTTKIYENLISAGEKEGCETLSLNAPTLILDKGDYSVKALSPAVNSVYSDLNNYSLTLLIKYKSNTLLFTGDAEKESELEMINSGINIDCDILKVGHHGSSGSSTKEFLERTTPQVSIISTGKGNSYNHPHTETIERLNKISSEIYRTDTVGTVIAKLYEGGFNIETDSLIELDGNN